jgi:hypothetical protein
MTSRTRHFRSSPFKLSLSHYAWDKAEQRYWQSRRRPLVTVRHYTSRSG